MSHVWPNMLRYALFNETVMHSIANLPTMASSSVSSGSNWLPNFPHMAWHGSTRRTHNSAISASDLKWCYFAFNVSEQLSLPVTRNIKFVGTTRDRTLVENDIQYWESDAFTTKPFIRKLVIKKTFTVRKGYLYEELENLTRIVGQHLPQLFLYVNPIWAGLFRKL